MTLVDTNVLIDILSADQDCGSRVSIPADFFIGAHAATAAIPILTRDTGRYRSYFPDVALITPD